MRFLIHDPEKSEVLRNSRTLFNEATAFCKGIDSFTLHPLKRPKRYGRIMSPCLQVIVRSCAHAAGRVHYRLQLKEVLESIFFWLSLRHITPPSLCAALTYCALPRLAAAVFCNAAHCLRGGGGAQWRQYL